MNTELLVLPFLFYDHSGKVIAAVSITGPTRLGF
ncbi:DNA-binding IclR family transcriptional regulator [Peribacillus frigoritolerans]